MLEEKRSWMRPATLVVVAGLTFGGATLLMRPATAKDEGKSKGDDSYDDDFKWDEDEDSTALTFTTVGDSRQDPVTFDPTTAPLTAQDAIWLQNSKAFSRILEGVEKQHSKLLVFNGDMIMGYGNMVFPAGAATVNDVINSDLVQAYRQYGFWRGMVAPVMENGTYVVPVPGNHETQYKAGGKKAQTANEDAWRANMGDLILDTNRFQALFGETPSNADVGNHGALDSITSDQSQLSYSFDFHGSHFAVVNTDPYQHDSHAPTNWLAADLLAAKNRGSTHFFVFGHKPAFTYYYGVNPAPLPATPSGIDVDLPARNAFWAVIEQYGAVYFCGHEHIFNLSQPTAASGGSAWQVMVGSGGSPFEAKPTDITLAKTDRYYAWAKVDVRKSGKVRITGYGFNDQFGPTKKLQSISLPH